MINMTGPYLEANPHTLGMVVAAAHAIENLLHLKEAFLECQMAENFQKTVISSIPEALIVINNKGLINLINQNAQKMLDLNPAKVLGKAIRDVLGRNGNENFLSKIENNKGMTDEEVRIYNENGSFADYTLSFNPVISPTMQVTGKVIILNEIARAKTMITKMTGAKAKITFSDIMDKTWNSSKPSGLRASPRKAHPMFYCSERAGRERISLHRLFTTTVRGKMALMSSSIAPQYLEISLRASCSAMMKAHSPVPGEAAIPGNSR